MNGSYGPDFRAELRDLMRWRRDVRRFRTDPVEAAVLNRCLHAFALAPSVGLSEPWRLIRVETADARAAVIANFEAANATALAGYDDEKARLYAGLKLSGMREAPVHLAVFCDETTPKGAGLGAQTMAETRAYSVVGAISMLWLAARAEGLGLGEGDGLGDGEGLGLGEGDGDGLGDGNGLGDGDGEGLGEAAAPLTAVAALIRPYCQYQPVPEILSAVDSRRSRTCWLV